MIDADGSVYEGGVKLAEIRQQTGREKSAGSNERAMEDRKVADRESDAQGIGQPIEVQLVGTNRTTNQRVVFDGQLLLPQQDGAAPAAVPVAASRITPPAKPARAGKPPIAQVPGSRGRLQGVAVVGGTNQLAIDARVTAP